MSDTFTGAESASERRFHADRAGMGRSYCLWSRSSFSLRISSFSSRFFLKILVASLFLNRSASTAIPSTAFTLNRARRPSDTHRDASISESAVPVGCHALAKLVGSDPGRPSEPPAEALLNPFQVI